MALNAFTTNQTTGDSFANWLDASEDDLFPINSDEEKPEDNINITYEDINRLRELGITADVIQGMARSFNDSEKKSSGQSSVIEINATTQEYFLEDFSPIKLLSLPDFLDDPTKLDTLWHDTHTRLYLACYKYLKKLNIEREDLDEAFLLIMQLFSIHKGRTVLYRIPQELILERAEG